MRWVRETLLAWIARRRRREGSILRGGVSSGLSGRSWEEDGDGYIVKAGSLLSDCSCVGEHELKLLMSKGLCRWRRLLRDGISAWSSRSGGVGHSSGEQRNNDTQAIE